jgi:uncharacterized RDD family membrane protein YckC
MNTLDDTLLGNKYTPPRYADIGRRIGAFFIDIAVLLPIIGLSFYNFITLKNLPLFLLVSLLSILYKPLLEYYYGATVGKMALKLKVVNKQNEGIELGQSFIRSLPGYLGSLLMLPVQYAMFSDSGFMDADTFMSFSVYSTEFNKNYAYMNFIGPIQTIFFIIDLIVATQNNKNQSIHDMMANTYVIDERNKNPLYT